MSELGDIEAIRRLTYEYAMAVDTMQLDAVIDLFMPDAVWDTGPGGPPVMNNRDEIREFYKGLFEASNNLYHLTSNHIINVHGDTATGTAYFVATGVTSNGESFGANGYYGDTYVRTPDGWKFQRRQAHYLLDPDFDKHP